MDNRERIVAMIEQIERVAHSLVLVQAHLAELERQSRELAAQGR